MSVNTHSLLQGQGQPQGQLIPNVDTTGWYTTQYGCLRSDPTLIARRHTFPSAPIPRGIPDSPAAPSRMTDVDSSVGESSLRASWSSTGVGTSQYYTAWPMQQVNASDMVDEERDHPQFAFRAGAPGTVYQIDVESQLLRLGTPLGPCYQGVIPMDSALFQNNVAPPPPMGVPEYVQNACNPVATLIRPQDSSCRAAADAVATSISNRWVNNPTRMDTTLLTQPFTPPGIGTPPFR